MNKLALVALVLAGCMADGELGTSDDSTAVRVDRVATDDAGHAYSIAGQLGHAATSDDAPAILARAVGISSDELHVERVETDRLGMTHVRMSQTKNGLRVVSGQAIVHVDRDGSVRSSETSLADHDLSPVPVIAEDAARATAVADTDGSVVDTRGELVYVISNRDRELHLAWEIRVEGAGQGLPIIDNVYVDAGSGRVVDRHPRIYTAKNRTVQDGKNGTFPVNGATAAGNETTPPTEAIAKAAFDNTGTTYDCYQTLFQRDSYDGAGATLTSQVHVQFDYGTGQLDKNNAMWAPDVLMMAYGDGDGTTMSPLARSLDVTAHELTHAVTSSTSDLVYQNESGALNESISDIMGTVCKTWKNGDVVTPDTWKLGMDIYTPGTPGDGLRYMDNPTLDQYSSDYYPEQINNPQDAGGVHGNSGISNLAFVLLVQGGHHPRNKTTIEVPGLGIDKAGQIFYRAETTKWMPNTNFAQARAGAEAAANELYPGTCAKSAVSLAFAAVGVGTAPPADTVPPTVAIDSPADGAHVASGFQVEATATDETCINKVELKIDGNVVDTKTEAPFTLNAGDLASGAHQVTVVSYDAFNHTEQTIRVNIGGTDGGGGDDDDGGPVSTGGVQDVTGGCNSGGATGGFGAMALALGAVLIRRRRR